MNWLRTSRKKVPSKLKCSKEHYLKAIDAINEHNVKMHRLDRFSHDIKLRIISNCEHNSTGVQIGPKEKYKMALPSNFHLLMTQLQKSIYKHDWSAAARCVQYLIEKNGLVFPIIYKSVILILLCHPESTRQHLEDFLELYLCLRTPEDKHNFLVDVLKLPPQIRQWNANKFVMEEEEDEEYHDEDDDEELMNEEE